MYQYINNYWKTKKKQKPRDNWDEYNYVWNVVGVAPSRLTVRERRKACFPKQCQIKGNIASKDEYKYISEKNVSCQTTNT